MIYRYHKGSKNTSFDSNIKHWPSVEDKGVSHFKPRKITHCIHTCTINDQFNLEATHQENQFCDGHFNNLKMYDNQSFSYSC